MYNSKEEHGRRDILESSDSDLDNSFNELNDVEVLSSNNSFTDKELLSESVDYDSYSEKTRGYKKNKDNAKKNFFYYKPTFHRGDILETPASSSLGKSNTSFSIANQVKQWELQELNNLKKSKARSLCVMTQKLTDQRYSKNCKSSGSNETKINFLDQNGNLKDNKIYSKSPKIKPLPEVKKTQKQKCDHMSNENKNTVGEVIGLNNVTNKKKQTKEKSKFARVDILEDSECLSPLKNLNHNLLTSSCQKQMKFQNLNFDETLDITPRILPRKQLKISKKIDKVFKPEPAFNPKLKFEDKIETLIEQPIKAKIPPKQQSDCLLDKNRHRIDILEDSFERISNLKKIEKNPQDQNKNITSHEIEDKNSGKTLKNKNTVGDNSSPNLLSKKIQKTYKRSIGDNFTESPIKKSKGKNNEVSILENSKSSSPSMKLTQNVSTSDHKKQIKLQKVCQIKTRDVKTYGLRTKLLPRKQMEMSKNQLNIKDKNNGKLVTNKKLTKRSKKTKNEQATEPKNDDLLPKSSEIAKKSNLNPKNTKKDISSITQKLTVRLHRLSAKVLENYISQLQSLVPHNISIKSSIKSNFIEDSNSKKGSKTSAIIVQKTNFVLRSKKDDVCKNKISSKTNLLNKEVVDSKMGSSNNSFIPILSNDNNQVTRVLRSTKKNKQNKGKRVNQTPKQKRKKIVKNISKPKKPLPAKQIVKVDTKELPIKITANKGTLKHRKTLHEARNTVNKQNQINNDFFSDAQNLPSNYQAIVDNLTTNFFDTENPITPHTKYFNKFNMSMPLTPAWFKMPDGSILNDTNTPKPSSPYNLKESQKQLLVGDKVVVRMKKEQKQAQKKNSKKRKSLKQSAAKKRKQFLQIPYELLKSDKNIADMDSNPDDSYFE